MYNLIIIIFTALLLIFIILELFFCFKENTKYRMIFKCFPLLFISIFILIYDIKLYLLSIAAFLYFIGDFLLLSNKKILFTIGAFSFFIGHVLLLIKIITMFRYVEGLYYSIIPTLICLILITIFLYKYLGKLFIGGALGYLGILFFIFSYLNAYHINLCIVNSFSPLLLVLSLGFLIYFISDILVVLKRFKGHFKREDFYIMSTYYLANIIIFYSLSFILSWLN